MAFTFSDIDENEIKSLQDKIGETCVNPKSFPDLNEFHEEWRGMNEKDLHYKHNDDEHKTKLYKIYLREETPNHLNHHMVKIYKLPEKTKKNEAFYNGTMGAIAHGFDLIAETKLLTYYGLYYDQKTHQLLLTMEALEMTLKEYIEFKLKERRVGVTETECKYIIAALLQHLWRLHRLGYLHCDIKPQNIMLRQKCNDREKNGWKLIDFDNAMFIGTQQSEKYKGMRGTPTWTAPEIRPLLTWIEYIDEKTFNHFSYGVDIWSIGLIILYILFGKQPFELTEDEKQKYMEYKNGGIGGYFYFKKLLKGSGYNIDSDKNAGEIWLRNYLISLYVEDKISKDLFDLLHDKILIFNPRKRANCKQIYEHRWFDEIRNRE